MASSVPASQFVAGLQVPVMFSAEVFQSALCYKPRAGDVFLVTYPKCGSTWSQHVLALVLRQGRPLESRWKFVWDSPHFEFTGPEAIEKMSGPGCIKSHLPFHLMPWSDQAKYIYMTRNPKDTCVSYYHHTKDVPGHRFNGTFDQYFELFIDGKVDYGDYFEHLLSWYEHRNDPNVLFLTYEEMKENFRETVLKIASFIDHETYAVPLLHDKTKLDFIEDFCSFKKLKQSMNQQWRDIQSMAAEKGEEMASNVPEGLKKFFLEIAKGDVSVNDRVEICRKGSIGDWKNYFSPEQSERMDSKFEERTKGTDICNFLKRFM